MHFEFEQAQRLVLQDPSDVLAKLHFYNHLERSMHFEALDKFSLDEFLGPSILGPYFFDQRQALSVEFLARHFLAWDRQTREVCRLSVLPEPFSRALGVRVEEAELDPVIQARLSLLDYSWKACANLNFKTLMLPYKWGACDSYFVIATGAVEGKTLDTCLWKLDPKTLIAWLVEILEELKELHERCFIHGDIRGDHIYVSTKGPQLTGFENRLLLAIRPHENTNTPTTIMTALTRAVEYSSPEEFLEQSLDARSDLYQIGLILYEYCLGRPIRTLFNLENSAQFDFIQLLSTVGLPRLETSPSNSHELVNLIMKAVSVSPAQRFQSTSEFRDALVSLAV